MTLTDQAMCCLSPRLPPKTLAEYVLLGVLSRDEWQLQRWLEAEFRRRTGTPPSPTGDWSAPTPKELWKRCSAIDNARAART